MASRKKQGYWAKRWEDFRLRVLTAGALITYTAICVVVYSFLLKPSLSELWADLILGMLLLMGIEILGQLPGKQTPLISIMKAIAKAILEA